MGIRTSIEIAVKAGLNFSLDDTVFDRTKSELLDTMNRAKSTTLQLAPSATDIAVPFDGITTARMIYIEAKGEITFKLGSALATATSIKRMVAPTSTNAANVCAYALLTAETTALYLTNPSASAAVDVTVCIVGDII